MSKELCSGCGAALQTVNPDAPGYIPHSAVGREVPVCKRCFRIRNYGEFSRVVVPTEVYAEEVSRIRQTPGLVLYVLDVFDLPGSMITDLAEYIGESPVVAVVNKVDLLPKEVHVPALEQWVRQEVGKIGIHPVQVQFVSGQTQEGLNDVLDTIDGYPSERVYVVGMANVGKSTILNKLLQQLNEQERFTASRVPGTTLGMVATQVTVPSGRTIELVDTPGLIHGNRVIDELCTDCLKIAMPQARMRPRVYQLNPEQTLWLGGFARFDFTSGPFQPVVCYVSNQLPVHRTKLERAEAIGEEHATDILKVPCPSCRSKLGATRRYAILSERFARTGRQTEETLICPSRGCDIVLSGLGWITLQGRPFRGFIEVPGHVQVTVRPRLVGDISRS